MKHYQVIVTGVRDEDFVDDRARKLDAENIAAGIIMLGSMGHIGELASVEVVEVECDG